MTTDRLQTLLQEFKDGKKTLEEVLDFLKRLPFEDLSFARVDHHRGLRRGFPEVVYGEGKTARQIIDIVGAMQRFGSDILVTRVEEGKAREVASTVPGMTYHPLAGILSFCQEPHGEKAPGSIRVLCAGSSDIPVAEEAAVTAEFMGNRVGRHYDVGVAGLHRLLQIWDEIRDASVYVVAAGMVGALPSVVAGLVDRPVIAVPTSVGYGAGFGGIAALLGMLNSCAPGIAVVNIDNGFGAGYLAGLINRRSGAGQARAESETA